MEIYLIRHTKVNIENNICYGQSDINLASSFIDESKTLLEKLPNTKNFICYTSPLNRCKLLAMEIPSQELKYEPRLMELNFGEWELKPWDLIGKETFDLWHSDFVNNPVPRGESYLELFNRSVKFLEEIIPQKKDVILITHGGVIRAILSYFIGLPLENSFRLKIDYGSVSKISLQGNNITLCYLNK